MFDEKNIKETLINNFLRISKIPRESGHEEKIAEFFVNVAQKNNLHFFKDKYNNVLIKKKGSIDSEPIALQAHLDMVCVKSKDSEHDFSKDGIEVIVDGDEVTAKDTSLGADQGVGLAMMLTIIENKDLKHPDLEFLFTTEEETTFNGAVTFPYSKVESKRIINLDSGRDDVVFIGSDGDICNEYCFKGTFIENNMPSYRIIVDGFPGGNSGDNIDLSENNAITTVAKLLKDKDIFIRGINGGTFENELAKCCEVILNTNLDINEIFQGLNAHIEKINNNLSFTKEDTENILNEILNLKCGYISKSKSSANLGCILTLENEIKIKYILRSINEEELENLNKRSIELKYGFKVTEMYRDSIWKADKQSLLLHNYQKVYFEEYHIYPKEEIAHGGIECSAINKRIDELDIISIGASMKNCHTIEEISYISSWTKIYKLLVQFLKMMTNKD